MREAHRELGERVRIDVDGEHPSRGTDRGGEPLGEVAAARADVGDRATGRDVEEREHARRLLPWIAVGFEETVEIRRPRGDLHDDVVRDAGAFDVQGQSRARRGAADGGAELARRTHPPGADRRDDVAACHARGGCGALRQDALDADRGAVGHLIVRERHAEPALRARPRRRGDDGGDDERERRDPRARRPGAREVAAHARATAQQSSNQARIAAFSLRGYVWDSSGSSR